MGRKRHRLVERRKNLGLSQENLAHTLGVETSTVARWERGETTPQPWHRPNLADALKVSVEDIAGILAEADGPGGLTWSAVTAAQWPNVVVGYERLEASDAAAACEEMDTNRRDVIKLAAALVPSSFTAASQPGAGPSPHGASPRPAGSGWAVALGEVLPTSVDPVERAMSEVARQLTNHGAGREPEEPFENRTVANAAIRAKRAYQAGQHRQIVDELPGLLAVARTAANGELGSEGRRIAADIYQTACSILLKFGEAGLALLAADRSTAVASQSGDPVAIAASARALAQALASNGHSRRAVTTALAAVQQLAEDDARSTPLAVAVRGALLLRASALAAASEDRDTALALLSEAQDVAERLDANDDNLYGTYFCTLNVQHKVNVAVRLGDAGQAVEYARHINPVQIPLGERLASHYLDLVQAFARWGKHHQAYEALCAAEQAAPQEVAVRPERHELITELWRHCPPSLRRPLQQLADRVGSQV